MLNQFVIALHQVNCRLFLVAGNHDSVAMLNESTLLYQQLSTTLITTSKPSDCLPIYPLYNHQQQIAALICLIPYLRPRDIIQSQLGEQIDEKQLKLQQAIHDYYQQLYNEAKKQAATQFQQPDLPILMTGHLTTVGAKMTESVRDIYIGNLTAFPSQQFPPADYIALGHIHKHQRIGNNDNIRYSGSPIALSFDEINQQKQVIEIEIEQSTITTKTLEVPRFQPLLALKIAATDIDTSLAPLIDQAIDTQQANQSLPLWLSLEVNLGEQFSQLNEKVNQALAERPVELLQLRVTKSKVHNETFVQQQQQLQQLTVEEVFQAKLDSTEITAQDNEKKQQLTTLFQELMHNLQSAES
jgi:exonuclease SbcD